MPSSFLAALIAVVLAAPGWAQGPAVQLAGELLDRQVTLVIRDLPPDEAATAADAAFTAMTRLAGLLDPDGELDGGIGRLNTGAGDEAVAITPEVVAVLERAMSFCRWSGGAFGPLGGRLNEIWAGAGNRPPGPEALAAALASASCDQLEVDRQAATARLAAGSRVDLWGFAAGAVVDRAIEVLGERGATNVKVELGGIVRAVGIGPGDGWWVSLPPLAGSEAMRDVRLSDRALALAQAADPPPLVVAGLAVSSYIDHRRGRPAEGVLAVAAASQLAADAQGLAATLFVTGSRDGQMRLGNLRPPPSVLWMLGRGTGTPLLVDYRWSELRR